MRRGGKSFAHPLAVLLVRPNGLTLSRLGVTTDRSLAGAVRRNRARRRTREALRPVWPRVRRGWDLVVVARAATLEAKFSDLNRVLSDLLERGGVLDDHEPRG